MLMLISAPAVTGNATGSLRRGAPAGIVVEGWPPKVTVWIEPGPTLEGWFGIATVAAPMRSGEEPYSLENRIRICVPPNERRTRSRTVWSSILLSGSLRSESAGSGLVAQVAIQALRSAWTGPERTKNRHPRAQLRSAFIQSIRALPQRRKIRRTHVGRIDSVNKLLRVLGFYILLEAWVGVKRVPVLFRFLPAGMSHKVNEGVVPSRLVVRHPEADDIEAVLGHQTRSIAKARFQSRNFPGNRVINEKLEHATAVGPR